MKTLQNFINEEHNINRVHEDMFHYIRKYSPAIYNALLYMSDICTVAFRYIHEDDIEKQINWKKAIKKHSNDDSLLDEDAIRALMDGESKCKPEYKLMVRCAEAALENEDGYEEQLEKELKSADKILMKEQ